MTQTAPILRSGVALVVDWYADYVPPGIPGSVADILGAIADQWNLDFWDVGRVACALVAQSKKDGLPVAEYHVYAAVAGWLHHEIAWQTVRHYAQVAGFFWDKEIDKYHALPFSHFAAAMQYAEHGTTGWQMVLDLSVSYMDSHAGRYPSVAWLVEAMSGRWYDQQVADMAADRPTEDESAMMGVEESVEYEVMVAGAPSAAGERPVRLFVLTSFRNAAAKLLEHIDRMQIGQDHKLRLGSLLDELSELIAEIIDGSSNK